MGKVRIGVVAPASSMDRSIAERVAALAAEHGGVELVFHPQCFESWGHFAGTDQARADAFVEIANDPGFDAVWFGRGGYGSCRMAPLALDRLSPSAKDKSYLGYSDMGSLLAGLFGKGFERVAHGPMPADINRGGGAAAVARALAFLADGAESALERTVRGGTPSVAFNITILCHLMGTALQPDLTGHVLMLEEVSEHLYRIDRSLCQLTSVPALRRVAGIMLGRCGDIPPNQPEFGQSEEEVARHWCAVSGIPYLGRADIGHDADNKVVPFGSWPWVV
ncbi:LD-carboxypeptidase [Paramagnetospirillum kuznetsovii]|uniref:LD-carboxypeptidase n=1 Tax=Paramagnetospirillum kuznetsovii TaxID=2053833 RepID=A0A364NW63_9PROT|nr:LD-carboxypeptidase [Paramagnetospirillum kuznetsovii]RAU21321.1 LD-carboxypeptidase [Paramagnetospirillum kuznetsovii]